MPFEFIIDPAWPWSLPRVGLPLLAIVAVLLAALTVLTYRGAAPRRRIAAVIALRLLALVLAIITLMRPALAFREDLKVPSVLLIAADASASMAIADEVDAKSRWFTLQRVLERSKPALDKLRDQHNVTVHMHRFAEEIGDFDPDGKADGPRTDFGRMLHNLAERYGSERALRGLIILSDGADNGTRYPALGEAARWRALGCPVQPFALGQANTDRNQRDIAFTSISPEPSPVPVKAKLTVKATLDAPGFEGVKNVKVHLLIDDIEVSVNEVDLPKSLGNEIQLTADAPANPGEIKVTLKADPLRGEATPVNNEISTFLTVTKEGVSVLYVDRLRQETKFIRNALAGDPRFRLTEATRQTDAPRPGETDFLQLDRQAYDVIILGDVSPRRLTAGGPRTLAKIEELVKDKGVGLLMTGGEDSLGGDWQRTLVGLALPVELGPINQVDAPLQFVPTKDGLIDFVLRLSPKPADNAAIWQKLPKLDGFTRLGKSRLGAVVLATTPSGEPLMVRQTYGKGRTMALAVDTTWLWTGLGFPKTTEGMELHAQFWKQLVIYLAQQEDQGGSVWVRPDNRRLAAGGPLGFTVGLRGKTGLDLPEGEFSVEIVGPGAAKEPVAVTRERDGQRGTHWKTDHPGEYRIVVKGQGKDADGSAIAGEASARVLIYQDDTELLRQAADHDFLTKLAAAGGGKFHRADELPRFLEALAKEAPAAGKQKAVYWPDWRSANTTGFLPGLFFAFVAVLGVEWGLRRFWGMV